MFEPLVMPLYYAFRQERYHKINTLLDRLSANVLEHRIYDGTLRVITDIGAYELVIGPHILNGADIVYVEPHYAADGYRAAVEARTILRELTECQ